MKKHEFLAHLREALEQARKEGWETYYQAERLGIIDEGTMWFVKVPSYITFIVEYSVVGAMESESRAAEVLYLSLMKFSQKSVIGIDIPNRVLMEKAHGVEYYRKPLEEGARLFDRHFQKALACDVKGWEEYKGEDLDADEFAEALINMLGRRVCWFYDQIYSYALLCSLVAV